MVTMFLLIVKLSDDPLSLQVQLLPSNSSQYYLYLSVDKRMGRLIASVLPLTTNSGMHVHAYACVHNIFAHSCERQVGGNRERTFRQSIKFTKPDFIIAVSTKVLL